LHLSVRRISTRATVPDPVVDVRRLQPTDLQAATDVLDRELGGRHQARLGRRHDVLELSGVGAWDAQQLVGVATYDVHGDTAELAAIAVSDGHRLRGIGTQLIDAVVAAVRSEGARDVWLVTTNDNVDALRLYQRRGFRLSELHAGAIDRARALKPAIPREGRYGIPIRDELVLTLSLST
jgi:ribosomal protein S18 acetylase RimI-like enzyme